MAETGMETKAPKRGRWLRWLALIAGGLVVLVIALYFVATSSSFFKGVILPRVGNAVNAEISVADAQISPFRQVTLRDVKVTPKGAEPLLTAPEVRARYSLLSIIRGTIAVDELAVVNPTVTIVENADGTSNLDPLLKTKSAKPPEKPSSAPSAKAGSPPVVDVKSASLSNATFRKTTNLKGGGRDVLEVANVNVTASNIKNGQAGKLDLAAALSMEKAARPGEAAGSLQAKLNGGFTFDLANDLKPKSVKGDATFAVEKATGPLSELNALGAKLSCEATPTEVKQLALRFSKANATLGELRASGPLDPEKLEGKLKIEILSLDRQVLNLAGAASGVDFGTTTINATSEVELAKGGSQISLAGKLDIARLQIIRQKQTTPTLDVRSDYSVSVDRNARTALLKTINLTGTQNNQPLLKAELTSPMTISWGGASGAMGDAALNLTLTGLNLADWKAFAPDAAPDGKADARLKLTSKQGGKQLVFELESHVQNFSARFGTNEVPRADARLLARGEAMEMKRFKLEEYRLEVAQQGQSTLNVSGSGTFDSATPDADLQIAAQATLGRLLLMFPQPDANFTAGTLDFKGRVALKKEINVTGELTLTDLTGAYGDYRFANFGTWVSLDVAMKGHELEIRKASGHLREGQNMGGNFEASWKVDPAGRVGQLKLRLSDFNQYGLRPFLESALGDKKLVSVRLGSSAAATISANGDASVKADLQVANLVVTDPKGELPTTPLEARVQLDTSVAKQVAQLRQCSLTLTPTERAKNQLDLTGVVDFSKSNAITGNLKLTSESLDVTRYYDLFSGKPAAAAKPGAPTPPPAPASAPASSDKEPDPVTFPFRNFVCDVNIGRLYLREIDISKLQTSAKLDGGHMVLKPCQLTLNGAPVKADVDLDLGVPGYRYDVAFNAQAVPLAPLVNSFQPERKGQIGGTTTANMQIKGAGVTGASLQKNLSGQFSLLATNMNLSVANVRSPLLKTLINVVVAIPELIKNPTGAVVGLLGKMVGGGPANKGWLDELTSAPINVILAEGKAGEGRVQLSQAEIRSAAFQAQANGDIGIEPILTNSTCNIPVTVALSRPLGEKIGLTGADANATYVSLGQLVTMKGTLGKPEAAKNTIALLALAAKTGGGVAKQLPGTVGGQVGGVLNAVGDLLSGNKTAPTTSPATNPPPQQAPNAVPAANAPAATNAAVNNLIRGLGGLLGGSRSSSTNAQPATNAPPR